MTKHSWPLEKPEAGKYVVAWMVEDGVTDVTEAILGYGGKALCPYNAWEQSDYDPTVISDRERCFWFYVDELSKL